MIKSIHFTLPKKDAYPFNIPSFLKLQTLNLNQPITIFVGENGSGKSTLLKAIAYYNDSINVSKHDMSSAYFSDSKELSKHMKLTYHVKTRSGFFFSGEDFITYINNLKALREQLQHDIAEIKEEFKDKNDYALTLALGPLRSQLAELQNTYDGDLEHRSHGEGFLQFFKARMHKKGLYLLDEPETPLSAINQYQLVVLLTDLARSGSQVIIATHSPILMALPQATIYQFDEQGIHQVQYEDIESVQFTKHFLNDPDNFIHRI
jgi:predicted ATPase